MSKVCRPTRGWSKKISQVSRKRSAGRIVIRLPGAHRTSELDCPLVDAGLELGQPDPAVHGRIAAAEHVQVHAVQDDDPHPADTM